MKFLEQAQFLWEGEHFLIKSRFKSWLFDRNRRRKHISSAFFFLSETFLALFCCWELDTATGARITIKTFRSSKPCEIHKLNNKYPGIEEDEGKHAELQLTHGAMATGIV